MPVNQLGTMTVPEPSIIVISPWDPSVVPLIDKAIRTSELGLNPTNDGKVVRVPIPSLTEERRKDIVKQLHKVLENHRTALRNVRRDVKEAVEKLEKDKKISEDEKKRCLDELEKLSHSETKRIEDFPSQRKRNHAGEVVLQAVRGDTLMKKHVPAGDEGDDQKAIRQEIVEAKAMMAKLLDAQANKILKKPKKEPPNSISTLQGGRPESNRRKF